MPSPSSRGSPLRMVGFFRSYSTPEACLGNKRHAASESTKSQIECSTACELPAGTPLTPLSNDTTLDTRGTEMTSLRKFSRTLYRNADAGTGVQRLCRDSLCSPKNCGRPPVPSHIVDKRTGKRQEALVRSVSPPLVTSPSSVLPQLQAIIRKPTETNHDMAVQECGLLRPQSASLSHSQDLASSIPPASWFPAVPTLATSAACQKVATIKSLVARKGQSVAIPDSAFVAWKGVVRNKRVHSPHN